MFSRNRIQVAALGLIMCPIIGLTILSGCSKNSSSGDPKKRLAEYISLSFSVKDTPDRLALAQYLTGNAKTRLVAWSDDQFRQAFMDTKRKFLKLVIQEMKARSATETEVTYEITYIDQSKGRDAKVTNKKMSEMTLDQGKWLIKDVHNIKELVEYQNEMSLP